MKAWIVPKGSTDINSLRLVERPDPAPAAGQVLIRVRAASLNYRDRMVAQGTYFGGAVTRDTIPLSDGAGEVVAVGPGVTRVAVGARVAATFFQPGTGGAPPAALGAPLDGVLAEQVVVHEDGVVVVPDHCSYEEAACLPCAGVTAWHSLFHAGRPIIAGESVLVLGTGGVSSFALQFARLAGARVIAISSSDEKIARLADMGITDTTNYRRTPDWQTEVLRMTGGRGVDCVVEVGGAGTLARSLQSLARGGKVALIGFVAGPEGDTSPFPLMLKGGSLHGIFVGDRPMFEVMNRAISTSGLRPIIDRVFPFDAAREAYLRLVSGAFMGKIVIAV